MKKNELFLAALVYSVFFSLTVSAQDARSAARIQAYETREKDSLMDKVSDWFATLGKSKEEKDKIREERQAQRRAGQSEEDVKKAAPEQQEISREEQQKRFIEIHREFREKQPATGSGSYHRAPEINDEEFFKIHHGGKTREEFDSLCRKYGDLTEEEYDALYKKFHGDVTAVPEQIEIPDLSPREYDSIFEKYHNMTLEEYNILYQKYHGRGLPLDSYKDVTKEEYDELFKKHHGGLSEEEFREKQQLPDEEQSQKREWGPDRQSYRWRDRNYLEEQAEKKK